MKLREAMILVIGTVGFASQIIGQFTGHSPNYLIVGGSLALLGVAPLLRLDERENGRRQRKETP
jgi:hypothetical protein